MMEKTGISGVYIEKNQLYTINIEKHSQKKLVNERIVKRDNREYRSWNPYTSKLAAAILNGLEINLEEDFDVLYLGAATGTTVSHISDICKKGMVYAVEFSPFSMKKLVELSEHRDNIIPILADASHPKMYSNIVPKVDLVYQDISQRNQAEIFISNVLNYLKKNGFGLLMVKARSIDVSLKPDKIYENVCSILEENKLNVVDVINLDPYEKDHAVIITKHHYK